MSLWPVRIGAVLVGIMVSVAVFASHRVNVNPGNLCLWALFTLFLVAMMEVLGRSERSALEREQREDITDPTSR